MYLPLLILASLGFSASSGITHMFPILVTPSILPVEQSVCTQRTESPHFSAVSRIDKYPIFHLLLVPVYIDTKTQNNSTPKCALNQCWGDVKRRHHAHVFYNYFGNMDYKLPRKQGPRAPPGLLPRLRRIQNLLG